MSLEFIEEGGGKQFLTGSRVSGSYFLLGEPAVRIVYHRGLRDRCEYS